MKAKDLHPFYSLMDSSARAHGGSSTILLNEGISLLACEGGFNLPLCPKGEDSYTYL